MFTTEVIRYIQSIFLQKSKNIGYPESIEANFVNTGFGLSE